MSDFSSILLRLSQVPKLGSVRIQQIFVSAQIYLHRIAFLFA